MNRKRFLAVILAVFMVVTLFPSAVFADPIEGSEPENTVELTEGQSLEEFCKEGYRVVPGYDSSIAWVDTDGKLNALKEGSTIITLKSTSGKEKKYTVKVNDYTDGSDVVGNLKILVRYNDSMSFYDGHSYLVFTSYKENVTIKVEDLYGGYDISNAYYEDIKDDISMGSNHSGTTTDRYFSFVKNMRTVNLDRGEVVTIGMYRDFDYTVTDAFMEVLNTSSGWQDLVATGKQTIVETVLKKALNKEISFKDALMQIYPVISDVVSSPESIMDGYSEGGVCFNRELYNQKLEYDQYENVTYDIDITEKQLQRLQATLQGHKDEFDFSGNSCAAIATNAWNAAVGIDEEGNDTTYKLNCFGTGIYSLFATPKALKECIMEKLPGYYLNNAEEVTEPDAGFEDETGWVYVTAPKKLEPEQETPIPEDNKYLLRTYIQRPDNESDFTEVYYYEDDVRTDITDCIELEKDTKVYIKSILDEEDDWVFLNDITINDESIYDDAHYDSDEEAYFVTMPAKNSKLRVRYKYAYVVTKETDIIQAAVGDILEAKDFAEIQVGDKKYDRVSWNVIASEPEGIVSYTDASKKKLSLSAAGNATVFVHADGNPQNGVLMYIEVLDTLDGMVKVNYSVDSERNDINIICDNGEEDSFKIPCSGYMVKFGSKLEIKQDYYNEDGIAISGVKCNGERVGYGETIYADDDMDIEVTFAKAVITGLPKKISLESKGDGYQLNGKVEYRSISALLTPVYDTTIRYESSDPLVSVDDYGYITVEGEIPEEGKAVIVTGYAGSSNGRVKASTKVILGDYDGDKTVGKLTVYARRTKTGNLLPHAAVAFTPYDDMNMFISYYEYNKPKDKYYDLIWDYEDNPDKYSTDTAVYSEDVDIEDRKSYFDTSMAYSQSPQRGVSLKSGETLTMSTCSFDDPAAMSVVGALLTGSMASSENTMTVMSSVVGYMLGDEIDGPLVFDSVMNIIKEAYVRTLILGHNPLDGDSDGGRTLNREIYSQFVGEETQDPNNYFTIEITADELAEMESYLADPENNRFAIFDHNGATDVKNIWNAAMYDRPELQIKGNYTRITEEADSIYADIALLRFKGYKDGNGGTDYLPKASPARHRWEITADKNTLTATCGNTDLEHHYGKCELFGKEYSLTIEADSCKYDAVKLTGLDEFNEVTGKQVKADKNFVKFYKADARDKVTGGKAVTEGTKDDGYYYAELTVDGVSAAIPFIIGNPEKGEDKPDDKGKGTDDQGSQGDKDTLPEEKLEKLYKDAVSEINALNGLSKDKKDAYLDELASGYSEVKADIAKQSTKEAKEALVAKYAESLAKTLNAIKAENDEAMAEINELKLNLGCRILVTKKKVLKLKWGKVSEASGYDIFAKASSGGVSLKKPVATVKSGATTTKTFKKLSKKKISKKKQYCFIVKAYKLVDGKKKYIATSELYTTSAPGRKKYTDVKKITLKKKSFTLSAGDTANINIKKLTKVNKKKKLSSKAKTIYYFTSDKNVATVSSYGTITAVGKGSCKIYCKAANGVKVTAGVTVK